MDAFGALADPVRRELLAELARGAVRVVDLAGPRPISRPAVSRHLRVLAEAGLVVAEDRGRERHYALRREGLDPVSEYVAGLRRSPLTDNALDALDTEVRRTARERRTSPKTSPTKETA